MNKETMNRALTAAHNLGASGDTPRWHAAGVPAYGPGGVVHALDAACAAAGRRAVGVATRAAPGDVWPVCGEAPIRALP